MTRAFATTAAAAPARAQASNSPRLMLLLLAALFFLPFVVGSGLFWLDWRPAKFGNHGELVQPPRALPESGLHHADGRALPTAELRGKWLLAVAVNATCDAPCQATLQQLGQVQLALNKEQRRVQRVLLVNGGDRETLAQLQRAAPDLLVASLEADTGSAWAWASAFDAFAAGVYVVDPLANVMLRYQPATDPRGVLKDLERLLKYSWLR